MEGVLRKLKRMNEGQRRDLWLVLGLVVVCCWIYLVGHGRYGLFDVDEAIFTRATIEMRQSELVAMPTYNGEPRYHKPPLIYWVQSGFMQVLGEDSLYAARLPSALAALATILLLGWGVWRLTGERRWGIYAAGVLGLSLSFVVIGRAATADGVLNLFSLALALWVVRVLYPGRMVRDGKFDHWVTGGVAALGFLAKGPIAWVPAAVIALMVFVARRRHWQVVWSMLSPWKTLAVVLLFLLPWVGLLVNQFGVGFFYEFFVVHNVNRYASGMGNSQSGSYFYYLVVLMVGFFPWALLLPAAVWAVIQRWQDDLSDFDARRALPILALGWAVFYVGFFSLSGTKLAHYIVPAYPALAIVVARWLSLQPRPKLPWWYVGLGGLWVVVLAVVFLAVNPALMALKSSVLSGFWGWMQVVWGFEWPPRDLMALAVLQLPVVPDVALPLVGVLLLLGVLAAWGVLGAGVRWAEASLGLVWAVCLGLIVWGVVPTVWAFTQAPLARMAMVVRDIPAGVPIIHLGMHKPSVLYLSGKRFLKLEKPLQLPEHIYAPETIVLTEQPTVPQIGVELATQGRGMILHAQCEGGYCLLVVGDLQKGKRP